MAKQPCAAPPKRVSQGTQQTSSCSRHRRQKQNLQNKKGLDGSRDCCNPAGNPAIRG